ncbi:MAG: IS1595 family transposase [Chloroflexi bacterium]|nr:IS1595 family transposase [Chloroflexota bacterium]
MKSFSIADFNAKFSDDDTALEHIVNLLYPNGITCKSCQQVTKHYRIRTRKVYSCGVCGTQVSPLAGTIIDHSPTPLRFWLHAMFLMASTRMGISAKQLERELGVTYKTAWRMFTQIRKLMAQDDGHKLFGDVEVDETYIGGKDINRHESKRSHVRGRGAGGKTIAVGLVERGGKAVVKVTGSVQAKDLIPILREHIPPTGTTTIFTDELHSYDRLGNLGYAHERVQHVAKQYVSGTAHVNNVEGLWSIVKNGIVGVNRHVSPQHLQGYLDAYVFRYNHRGDETPMFTLILNRLPSAQGGAPS